ncbi:exopolysaccharide biosynthesis protein [Novipirellula rosea]|uniref:Exopolysaccharide biosynthesis protein n=1 Tax=Novipirellula rosea TaxID=1031540 RepID=A0ABP8MB68_9BACT
MSDFTVHQSPSSNESHSASSPPVSRDSLDRGQSGTNQSDQNQSDQKQSDAGQSGDGEVHDLRSVLDRVEAAAKDESKVSIGDVMDRLGKHSFAPMLLLPGLIMVAPVIGDIPGVPVMMGLIVILGSVQVVMKRDHFWIPGWLENRKVNSSKVSKTIGWLRKPARFLDRWSKERYTYLVDHAGIYVIAAVCIVIAAATPVMEVVPMSANVAGAAITAFGLAILARDGLIAMLAIAFSLLTAGLLIYQWI